MTSNPLPYNPSNNYYMGQQGVSQQTDLQLSHPQLQQSAAFGNSIGTSTGQPLYSVPYNPPISSFFDATTTPVSAQAIGPLRFVN